MGGELVEEAQHFLISPQIMDDEVIDDLLEEAYPFFGFKHSVEDILEGIFVHASLILLDLDGKLILQVILKDVLVAISELEVSVFVRSQDHLDDEAAIFGRELFQFGEHLLQDLVHEFLFAVLLGGG